MWKKALNKFIEPYKANPDVEAILLVGSYAVGNQNDKSDIDVYIILNDNVDYQERGNLLIDNYLIEYFMNPIYKVKKYIEEDERGHGGAMANMLINGKILYDKNNIVEDLKKIAIEAINQILDPNPQLYYACWDAYDEYEAAAYHNELQYYNCLQNLIKAYILNNGYLLGPMNKIEKVFKNKEYRERYQLNPFPENEFNELVINCFDEPNADNLRILYNFVLKDGNFNINNYCLRNKLDKKEE